jgi:hypothetical protein
VMPSTLSAGAVILPLSSCESGRGYSRSGGVM